MRSLPFDARALRALFALGWRRAAAERAALAGRLLLYVLILVIFWQLWRATPLEELSGTRPAASALLWYVAVTEWIVFAAGTHFRGMEAQIVSGDVERALVRPVPFGIATLAEWTGATAFNLLAIGVCGVGIATWLTGGIPIQPATVLPLLLSGALASAIVMLCQIQLGYAAVWLGTSAPPFWIWQKLLFVFGGLLIPLTLYPEPLRAISVPGPFAAMLFAPGSLVLSPGAVSIAGILAQQAFWLLVILVATAAIDRAAAARLADRGS